jgi:YidC/Oxa1 family membrane protein insertase
MVISFLYSLIIFPLVQFIELTWIVIYKTSSNPGLAILAVSAAVSICTLPLYFIAEKHQRAEREIQKRLKPEIDNIKAVFSGDEQYMILSTYYRQNHYHPVYALRSSLGLLIQIPFFIAAYSFLSHLGALNNVPFLFVKDLGAPDALLPGLIAGYSLNVLPVLMTLINCVAGAVYTRGLPVKEKVQLYGMALVFLVLLYNSPSGLVLYWTMNNVISLIKNCLQRIKNSKKFVFISLYVAVAFLDAYIFFIHRGAIRKRVMFIAVCSLVFLKPLVGKLYAWGKRKIKINTNIASQSALGQTNTFVFSVIILFLLAGLVIPGALIASSVQEFSFIEDHTSPLPFAGNVMMQAAGIFLFWPLCFYALFSKKTKNTLAVIMSLLCIAAIVNTFVFSGNYGFMTPMLKFSNAISSELSLSAMNIAVLIFCMLLALSLLYMPKRVVFFSFQLVAMISLASFGIINVVKIQREYTEFASRGITAANSKTPGPLYSFSKTGKNVLMIMLDRGISGYVPYIFEEKPELKGSFEGFTWYRNCISFGAITLFGAPGLYGGYEYTPLEMQKRADKPLVEKHNEALMVLPRLFHENGYSTIITDPPFANYSWTPDLRAFNGHPEIHAENVINQYSAYWLQGHENLKGLTSLTALLKNNLIRFSLFKIVPPVVREFLYDDGRWLGTEDVRSVLSQDTLDNYAILDVLPDITAVSDGGENSLMVICNNLTHEPAFFQAPDYIPVREVTDKGSGPYAGEEHYHANIAAYLLLGKWFSFLKENGVYDNTRIIIVSDHGGWGGETIPDDFAMLDGASLGYYRALLLVKDFDMSGDLTVDDSFMTNADTPFLLTKDLIVNPVNPFTQKPIQSSKEDGAVITTARRGEPSIHGKYQFIIKDDEWLHVHNSIFDPNNWERVGR